MEQCRTDPCVIRMVVDGKVELIVAVQVDDIVIAGSDEKCRDFYADLAKSFLTNNLGELTWYTGKWGHWRLRVRKRCLLGAC